MSKYSNEFKLKVIEFYQKGNYAEECIENEKLVENYLTLSILRS